MLTRLEDFLGCAWKIVIDEGMLIRLLFCSEIELRWLYKQKSRVYSRTKIVKTHTRVQAFVTVLISTGELLSLSVMATSIGESESPTHGLKHIFYVPKKKLTGCGRGV